MVIYNAAAAKEKLRFLIYGKQGTWKSSLCLDFARMKREDGKPFRVLYIDAEVGSIDGYLNDLEKEGIDRHNIFIVTTQSLTEVRDIIKKVSVNEEIIYSEEESEEEKVALDADGNVFVADAIVVDGLSLLYTARQQAIVEFSKRRANVRAKKKEIIGEEKFVAVEGAGLEQKDYQTLKFDGQALLLDLIASGKHFAVTCREEDVKENVKDKDGSIKMIATGEKKPQGFKDVAYNVRTVLHMLQDEETGDVVALVENKDRTKVCKQNEIIEKPTLLIWQTVIDRNKNKKDIVTTNALNKSVDVEVQNIKNDLIGDNIEDVTTEEVSVDEVKSKISSTLKSLTSIKKNKAKSLIEKAELPVRYNTIDNIDTLNKYLSIIESVI